MGMGIVGYGVWTLIKSVRTNDWPVTDGVIQSAQKKFHRDDNDGNGTYSAEVTYTYQVAGVNYDGNKIAIGQMSSSAAYAQGVLNRYPIGKTISVHYAPDNPTDAVLETGVHGGSWIGLVVGTFFTLFGLMFLQVLRTTDKAA